jgi:hypothetical protein
VAGRRPDEAAFVPDLPNTAAAWARANSETSEWRELWTETDSAAEADIMIAHLRSALV